jgi:KUP system potassium uptake protein
VSDGPGPPASGPQVIGRGHSAAGAPAVRSALVLGALGVVFGDIGTSPLYALQTVFSIDHGEVRPTPGDVYGVISLVFWSVTLIVSVKYVTVVMRADNDGEGGVMALAALVRRVLGSGSSRTAAVIVLGILGASLFYGDSVITPAISVLSAVEGLKVTAPGLAHLVVPIAVTILTVLFAGQRFGTHRVGSLFGPVMAAWFAILAVTGLREVIGHPGIIKGLSPSYAAAFIGNHPFVAFVAMGAVVLCITGAEALYADMGHFGRPPIRRAWFAVVFPALTLNYLGQGALILHNPAARVNPFFLLAPSWARLPLVLFATVATVIASQAVISGAFSVSRQAMQLGLLPPMTVRQTSEHEAGQVYLPAINAGLFVGVLVLTLAFRSSERLATAYGVAVTGALLIDTVLLLIVARTLWRWPTWKLAVAAIAFGGTEATFFSANLSKVTHGGWLPLLIAAGVFTLMTTWQRGRAIVTANRTAKEGRLGEFLDEIRARQVPRIPRTGVFPHPTRETTPLALRANVEHVGALPASVVIVSAQAQQVPHIPPDEQLTVDDLGYSDDGIMHVTIRYGFGDQPDIPRALRLVSAQEHEVKIDVDNASYFVSRATLGRTRAPGMRPWRKLLFITLAHNAADPARQFALPIDQTVAMGFHIEV